MSARRSTSTRDAADVATTEEAQGQEVSGGSSHTSCSAFQEVIPCCVNGLLYR